jgi:hypothetical protein
MKSVVFKSKLEIKITNKYKKITVIIRKQTVTFIIFYI